MAVEIKTSKKNHSKLTDKLATDQKELEKTTALIAALIADFKEIESGAKDVKVSYEKAVAIMEEKEGRMRELRAEHDAVKAEVG